MDTWGMIRAERAALADALSTLDEDAFAAPSLCPGWTVRDVTGHLIATAELNPPRFFGAIISNGFNFGAMTTKAINQVTEGATGADLVSRYRSRVDSRNAPPGPAPSWLGETIVHGEDIFRALGTYRDHPADHLVAVARFYQGSNLLIGAKRRIEGVTLQATDADYRHGTGPELTGPLVALVMAMTGRTVALDDLSGDGVDVLRGRA